MGQTQLQTPVLFTVFNRPDTTRQVFTAIRAARPKQLFVAADGPRKDRPQESASIEAVREMATQVDWECDLKTLFQEKNLGCRIAMSSAIDWFFSEVEEGIILEDDCLPDPSFFRYCTELLERYRNDKRIMNISGTNGLLHQANIAESYYFSCYPHIWGWASWRRAWQNYDVEMADFPLFEKAGLMTSCFSNPAEQKRWQEILRKVHRHDPNFNTWDAQWSYAHFKHNALSITPQKNLITNIGCTSDALHTSNNIYAGMSSVPVAFPLQHPHFLCRSTELDKETFRYDYANPLGRRILRKLQRLRKH